MTHPRWKYGLLPALLALLTTALATPLQAHTGRLTARDDVNVTFFLYRVTVVTPTATIVADTSLYWPGDTATISLDLDAVSNLYGLGGHIAYDTTRLRFDDGSVAPGPLLDDGLTTTTESHDGDGALAFSAWRTGGVGVTGSGAAVTMRFSVMDFAPPGPVSGTASIVSLTDLQAVDASGAAIPLAPARRAFTIGGVWPGDTDNNCMVDQDDLLPIGAYFGATGPARQSAFDLAWEAKAFASWGGSSRSPEFFKSFIDATGDGVINQNDALAIGVNRGAQREAGTSCTPPGAGKHTTEVRLGLDPQAVGAVVTVALDLTEPMPALLGTAFKLSVDPSVLKLDAVTAGALLDDGDLMMTTHLDTEAGTGAAAFTRKGAERAVGEGGTLAVLTLEVVGAMTRPSVLSLRAVKLSTVDAGIVAASEQAVALRRASATAAPDKAAEAPTAFVLEGNYPNPFNPQTTIRFGLPESAEVRLVVYDVLGRPVRVLIDGTQQAGTHQVVFEAADLPSGLYLYRLETPQGSFVKTMLVVK